MTKKKKKASNNRLLLFGTMSVFVIAFFVYTLFSYIIQVRDLNNEQLKIENDLYTLKEEESNLKNEIEKLKDPDYLARYARENYMYSKDGEYIIKVPDKESESNNENIVRQNKNYIAIIVASSILLIVILFLKRVF